MEAVIQVDPAPWVREVFLEKYRNSLGGYHGSYFYFNEGQSRDELTRHLAVLERLPEADEFLEVHEHALSIHAGEYSDLPEADQERVRALLGRNGREANAGPLN